MTDVFSIPSREPVIALFGEVLVDVFPEGKVLGGAPFNVARHLKGLGLYPLLITRTGSDEIRDELLATMDRLGMDTRGVQSDPVHPSGQVNVKLSGKEHSFEIMPDRAYDHIHAGLAHMIALASHPHMIYFGTLAQRSMVSRRALTALLRSSKVPRLLDLNLRAPWYDADIIESSLRRADIAKMNEDELSVVASMLDISGQDAMAHAVALVRCFDLQQIVITGGGQGAWQLARGAKKPIHVATQPLDDAMVDTVGAGDGFSAVLIYGTLKGWPVGLILERANAFAASICGIRGAIPPSQDFYIPFLEEWEKCPQSRTTAKILCTS